MTDLGQCHISLALKSSNKMMRIFISQKKFVGDILKKFKIEHSKLIYSPFEETLKLTKENGGKRVDSTYYKSFIRSLGC